MWEKPNKVWVIKTSDVLKSELYGTESKDPWKSELWKLLKPFVYFCRYFALSYLTDPKSHWTRKGLKVYCALSIANSVACFIMSLTWYNSSDGLKPDTIFKVITGFYLSLSILSSIFSLRLQHQLEPILISSLAVNLGKIPNLEVMKKWRLGSMIFMVCGSLFLTITLIFILIPGPIEATYKPYLTGNTIGNVIWLLTSFTTATAYVSAISFTVLIGFVIVGYIEESHKVLENIHRTVVTEAKLSSWLINYRLLVSFIDCSQNSFGWFILISTTIYCAQLVMMLLMFTRGSHLPVTVTVIFAALGAYTASGLFVQLIPIVQVNEKVN